MTTFNELFEKHREKLELYVPVVARVHGDTHPEFHEVKKHFDVIREKLYELDLGELKAEFEKLSQITDHFAVPGDVCETYEAVYQMLSELHTALPK
ncbi:MAG: iron-sulfur cluster repair di-iron protein, ric [Eubacteriales bacterium]|jgi:regulator of cell morphogenesis and NO signaling|nr:iron-sulfur cluster repair di-iron protein, ric [Eubacteriales bacterium]MDY0120265.1 iron-sulfur cluster repair di-iron protein, ric [Clostridia bacterium]